MENLNRFGYYLNCKGEIERVKYRDYLREFGSDETTSPRGVAPRLFIDGNMVMSWGTGGNNLRVYKECANKTEAKNFIFECWEANVYEGCDIPQLFFTKKELYEDLAEIHDKEVRVIKRYFRMQDSAKERLKKAKISHDSRPLTTKETMLNYLGINKELIQTALNELDALKMAENKELWQVKANSLVQKVCNNDFRVLKWKEVYNLIRA